MDNLIKCQLAIYPLSLSSDKVLFLRFARNLGALPASYEK